MQSRRDDFSFGILEEKFGGCGRRRCWSVPILFYVDGLASDQTDL